MYETRAGKIKIFVQNRFNYYQLLPIGNYKKVHASGLSPASLLELKVKSGRCSSVIEHSLGKGKVGSLILPIGSLEE